MPDDFTNTVVTIADEMIEQIAIAVSIPVGVVWLSPVLDLQGLRSIISFARSVGSNGTLTDQISPDGSTLFVTGDTSLSLTTPTQGKSVIAIANGKAVGPYHRFKFDNTLGSATTVLDAWVYVLE